MSDGNWLATARQDLAASDAAVAAGNFSEAGFRAQRVVVASARALMVAMGEDAPAEETLADVLDWIPPAYQASFEDQLRVLDNYYPQGQTVGAAQASEAVAWAHDTLEKVAVVVAELG